MTGWGKTLWTKVYSSHARRMLVFDPTISYPRVGYDNANHGLDEFLESIDGFSLFEEEDIRREFRVGTSNPERVSQLGGAAFVTGNNLLVLEEASMLFEKGQRRLEPWLSRIVFLGRHQRCSVCVLAQRFMSIPIDIRSQASRVVTFNQHEEDDVSYLQSVFGKEDSKRINSLPKFMCLDRCGIETFEYSIVDLVKKDLGIELDRGKEEEYTSYYRNSPHVRK